MSQVKGATAMLPYVGPVVNYAVSRIGGDRYNDNIQVSPVLSQAESAISAPYSVKKALEGKGGAKKAIRDTLTLLSFVTKLPLAALGRPLGYAADVAEGKKKPRNAADYVRGLVVGK